MGMLLSVAAPRSFCRWVSDRSGFGVQRPAGWPGCEFIHGPLPFVSWVIGRDIGAADVSGLKLVRMDLVPACFPAAKRSYKYLSTVFSHHCRVLPDLAPYHSDADDERGTGMDRLTEMKHRHGRATKVALTDAAKGDGYLKSAYPNMSLIARGRGLGAVAERTTRRVSPTEIGLAYYDRARRVLE